MDIYPKKIARKKVQFKKNTCFVLMPFEPEFDDIYSEIKMQLKKKANFEVERADNIYLNSSIMDIVVSEILASHFVVADLTGKNPNVFYELGIAHSFKDAPNIILISQNMEDVPADLRHLTIIIYEADNPMWLVSQIEKKIKTNKNYFEVYFLIKNKYYFKFNNENDIEEIMTFLSTLSSTQLDFIINSFENENTEITPKEEIIDFIKYVNLYLKQGNFNPTKHLLNILVDLLVSNMNNIDVKNMIHEFLLNNNIPILDVNENIMQSTIIDLCIESYRQIQFRHEAVEWIFNYLKKSKVAGIDIHRSKVESFIIMNTDIEVEEAILNLINTPHEHLREVIADICGEKKIKNAENKLISVLNSEENPYVARSIISALEKLKSKNGVHPTVAWIERYYELINTQWDFVLRHTRSYMQGLDSIYFTHYSMELNDKLKELSKVI